MKGRGEGNEVDQKDCSQQSQAGATIFSLFFFLSFFLRRVILLCLNDVESSIPLWRDPFAFYKSLGRTLPANFIPSANSFNSAFLRTLDINHFLSASSFRSPSSCFLIFRLLPFPIPTNWANYSRIRGMYVYTRVALVFRANFRDAFFQFYGSFRWITRIIASPSVEKFITLTRLRCSNLKNTTHLTML